MSVIINGIEYMPRIKLRIDDCSLGEIIRKYRKSAKLSLDKAALETGLSKSYLWELENGSSEPSLRTARALSEAYGVPIATLAAALNVASASVKGCTS